MVHYNAMIFKITSLSFGPFWITLLQKATYLSIFGQIFILLLKIKISTVENNINTLSILGVQQTYQLA